MLYKLNKINFLLSLAALSLAINTATFAQDRQVRKLISGQKYKIQGVVVARSDNDFLIRDTTGVDTKVIFTSGTSIKSSGFWSSKRYPASSLVRGLNLKVEGRGDATGALAAKKIRFDKRDLKVAESLNSRIGSAEERITKTEQNAERLSGQIDELMAISNAARDGVQAAQNTADNAQNTADAAVEGVNATNTRISALDNYIVQSTSIVNFRVNSHKLSPEAKAELDNVAAKALTLQGYVLEVTGYASSDGNYKANKILSQKRAKAVVEYLVDNYNIPLRRVGTSYGYGENKAIADNSTLEGRRQNRRVEVKILVSQGLNQNVEVRKAEDDETEDDGNR